VIQIYKKNSKNSWPETTAIYNSSVFIESALQNFYLFSSISIRRHMVMNLLIARFDYVHNY